MYVDNTTPVGGKARNHSCCTVSVKQCQFGTLDHCTVLYNEQPMACDAQLT